jgi:uncharacterized protein (TIGR02145 family)
MKSIIRTSFPILSTLLLILQAAAVQAQNESPPPFPPPGKLVDVGGWRLHLNCTGESRAGQPTVILEPGLGDFSVEWSLVQPGVAKFARVCSYDRAGDGWSDWGPHPRTFRQIVYELHTLLDKAGVKPPLVLVGHSYGGWLARLYAFTYPSDVAGMALVDVGADDPWRMTNGKLARSSELVKGVSIPAIKTSGPLRLSDIPPEALRQMKAGAQSLVPHANDPPRDKLPPEAQRMRGWALGQLGHIAAGVNPFEIEELAALRAQQVKSEYPFGDKPLIVLTRGIPEEHGPDGKALEEERRRNHAAVAKRSRQGKLIVATRSGHHIQMDEPELVIQSIRDVVDAASERKGNVRKDQDGNTYTSKIMLDGKRWMTQNLNINVTGSYCYDDKQANCDRYGRLYTWEAAKKACDMLGDGWRLPTADEWRAMAKQYGGVRDDSGETGKSAYKALLVGGSSEFNALLGGNRDSDGKYSRFDAHGFYWSATEHRSGEAWFLNFGRGSQALYLQNGGEKSRAWSVRCVRP